MCYATAESHTFPVFAVRSSFFEKHIEACALRFLVFHFEICFVWDLL